MSWKYRKCLGEIRGGSGDAFAMKLDSNGNLLWLKQLGGTTVVPGGAANGVDSCNGVAVDSSGNVYCSGTTTGSLGELNGSGGSLGGSEIFVMKLTSSGTISWIKQLGNITTVPGDTNSPDFCLSIAIDNSGNVYCGGSTLGDIAEVGGGEQDVVVAKFSSTGSLTWIKQLGSATLVPGGSTLETDKCNGIAVDNAGNVYCAGETTGSLGELNGGAADIFVMKMTSSGNISWIKQIADTNKIIPETLANGFDYCFSITLDSDGGIYCAGSTGSAMTQAHGDGISDAFVMKLNTSGDIAWLTHFGATTMAFGGDNSGFDRCTGVAVDHTGNVYCAGYTTGAIGEVNSGSHDIFVMKLNPSGDIQ